MWTMIKRCSLHIQQQHLGFNYDVIHIKIIDQMANNWEAT